MKLRLTLLFASLALPALATSGFDAAHFIDERCSSCHDERVYTRPDRRVGNRAQLDTQVRRCDANLGTTLFDEDIGAVVDYLDRRYYRFQP